MPLNIDSRPYVTLAQPNKGLASAPTLIDDF